MENCINSMGKIANSQILLSTPVRTPRMLSLAMTISTSSSSLSTASSSHSSDYQFMQRSKLPTMHFQRSLPRLPIPELSKTCERFLNAVQPILTPAQLQLTNKIVAEFNSRDAIELNALLKQKDANNKNTSYISEPWFNMYLSDRSRLPLNCNPLMGMRDDPRPEYQDQLVRATNIVISSLRFWRSLNAGVLEPEVFHLNPKKSDTEQFRKWMRLMPGAFATYAAYAFKAFPLDMSQYNRLFGVSRIPELGKDILVQCADSRHILVMRRGNMYALDVISANGEIESPQVIMARMKAVLQMDDQRGPAQVPLGALTGENRDSWARTRTHLMGLSSNNAQLLEQQVDSALFCICLDSPDDPVNDERNPIPLIKHLLASNGTNRWFDKSFSMLVSADATAAINFEHSWGDGVAVLRYFNEIFKETTERPFVSTQTSAAIPVTQDGCIRSIDFDTDDKVKQDVIKAIASADQINNSLNINILRYFDLNKSSCKQARVSPDSIMQLSFQLAYRHAYDDYVGTYESCSTAAFRHGRTETMRPCTMATRQFCEAVLQPASTRPSVKELRAIIDECSKYHGQLTKEAAMGQGFDRHLFALRNMAVEHNRPIPELYNSEAYKKINYNIISTSTLSSNALQWGAFGPVVQDGLGIGYSIQNDECGAIVSSYEGQRDGRKFLQSLEFAMNQICDVLRASKE